MKKLGIVTIIMALMLFLVSSVYAVAPVITTVPDQTKNEDVAAWTLDLSEYVDIIYQECLEEVPF